MRAVSALLAIARLCWESLVVGSVCLLAGQWLWPDAQQGGFFIGGFAGWFVNHGLRRLERAVRLERLRRRIAERNGGAS